MPPAGARRDWPVELLFRLWSYTYDHSILQPLFYRRVHAAVLSAIRPADADPGRILDLGCGTARLAEDLARRFPRARVCGVDVSQGMLAAARRRLGHAGPALVRASAYGLPFAGAAFDLIVSSIAYHWFLEPQEALAEIRRVLRPGGCLILATPVTLLTRGVFLGMRLVPARQHAADLRAAGFAVEGSSRVFPHARVFVARRR